MGWMLRQICAVSVFDLDASGMHVFRQASRTVIPFAAPSLFILFPLFFRSDPRGIDSD
jgi:hypothetical protein